MANVQTISPQDLASLRFGPKIEPLDLAKVNREKPISTFGCIDDGVCLAYCSIWTHGTPSLNGRPVGVIGHYNAGAADAGVAVLHHASQKLAEAGFAQVVGPMDGTTWRRYRLITQRGSEPPFFLEPDHPPDYPSHFERAGFSPRSAYFSAVNADLSIVDPRTPARRATFESQQIQLRNIRMDDFETELQAVYELSIEAFAGNFLYTPIAADEFKAMYTPLRPLLRSELIILAEQAGRLVGFIFGLTDQLEIRRGAPAQTIIAKTMAVLPALSGMGVGSVLIDEFQQAARRLGYRRVIHALMFENNRSKKISAHFGEIFRQYTLYTRQLVI